MRSRGLKAACADPIPANDPANSNTTAAIRLPILFLFIMHPILFTWIFSSAQAGRQGH